MGKHYMLNLYGCPFELLNNELFLRQIITEASIACKANLIDIMSKQFHPQGVTVLALLSESHISIHTWPEKGEAAVDVYTCGNARPELACGYLSDKLQATKSWMGSTER